MKELLYSIIPAVFCGVLLWYIKRYFDKLDRKQEATAKACIQKDVLLLKGVSASLSLGEATAEAIETQHWNGEMTDARAHAKNVKRDIEEFMCQQASNNVN